jgi:hypothetical protein
MRASDEFGYEEELVKMSSRYKIELFANMSA